MYPYLGPPPVIKTVHLFMIGNVGKYLFHNPHPGGIDVPAGGRIDFISHFSRIGLIFLFLNNKQVAALAVGLQTLVLLNAGPAIFGFGQIPGAPVTVVGQVAVLQGQLLALGADIIITGFMIGNIWRKCLSYG